LSSVNVGYFGNDLNLIQSNWNKEYVNDSTKVDEEYNAIKPLFYNYELAPSKSQTGNVVSKLCIISPDQSKGLTAKNEFYANRYYYHFNQ
jgi:hypothetical protein